jgi:hypothetical protein
MAVLTNEYVEYDTTGHFYYLTEAGLIEYTGYEYLVNIWKNPKSTLKKMGRKLHNLYTDSYHNNKSKYSKHRDLIHYNIYLDENNERQAIINALAYMIELEEDIPSWFKKLLAGEIGWPNTIISILKQANVFVVGEMSGSIDEDDYESGY